MSVETSNGGELFDYVKSELNAITLWFHGVQSYLTQSRFVPR